MFSDGKEQSFKDVLNEWLEEDAKNSAKKNIEWIRKNPKKAARILWYYSFDIEKLLRKD